MPSSNTKHTELPVGIAAIVVLGSLDSCAVALNGDGRLSSAGLVVIVDNITGRRIVLVGGAHVDEGWRRFGRLGCDVRGV
jgi:hypothetical protein